MKILMVLKFLPLSTLAGEVYSQFLPVPSHLANDRPRPGGVPAKRISGSTGSMERGAMPYPRLSGTLAGLRLAPLVSTAKIGRDGRGAEPTAPGQTAPSAGEGCLIKTLTGSAGANEIITRAGFPRFIAWISRSMAPRIRSSMCLVTCSSAGAKRRGSSGAPTLSFRSMFSSCRLAS